MQQNQGPFGTGVFEGAFASLPRYFNGQPRFPSGVALPGGFVAPVGGVLQGRFGWASNATHQVQNTRVSASDQLGLVLPMQVGYGAGVVGFGHSWVTYDPVACALRIRQGIVVTLMTAGDFWLKFAGGAWTGMPVYASLVDGSAVAGQTDNAELTPWKVVSNCQPGALAKVSNSAFFGA